MERKKSKLILLPNLLYEEEEFYQKQLPQIVEDKIAVLDGLFAESEKGGRRYLKRFPFPEGKSFRDIQISLLNEHTKDADLQELLAPVLQGQTWGIVSDAGLPCLADPGAKLVSLARSKNIQVEACSGPSSLFLALMLSGLSAQRFCFQGYLERDPNRLKAQIKELEKNSYQQKMTQVFIEAPYRCNQMLDALLEVLNERTMLSVSMNLTAPDEWVQTLSVKKWRGKERPDLHKKYVVFLFSSEGVK